MAAQSARAYAPLGGADEEEGTSMPQYQPQYAAAQGAAINVGGRMIPGYTQAQRAVTDATAAVQRWPTLKLEAGLYTDNSGVSRELMKVGGLLPINFRGASYNIPVSVWVPAEYPTRPATPYVTPTREMDVVKGHQHVGADGMCYFPYCNQWNQGSNVVGLMQVMQEQFSQHPPVTARAPGAAQTSPQPEPERPEPQLQPEPQLERAPLVGDVDEESAAGVGREAVPGDGAPRDQRKPAGRVRRCCFALCECKIRGFRLPDFLRLLRALVLPTSDAWLDWAVLIEWYLDGDVHWAEAALSINLVSGALSGLLLGKMLCEKLEMGRWKAYPLGLVVGVPGLAPVGFAALLLYTTGEEDNSGLQQLKWFKALELVFEAMPQSILQTYVGVSYGRFDPSSPTFSYLLPISVTVSLLGAGATAFGFEAGRRDADGKPIQPESTAPRLSQRSRYGVVALLFRTAQATALIFWIALLGCAEKGWAGLPMLLAVAIFGGMVVEAAKRSEEIESIWPALGLSAVHLGLVGGMAAVFFGDERAEGWVGAAVVLLIVLIIPMLFCLLVGCTRKFFGWWWSDSDDRKKKIAALCCALVCVPLILVSMGYTFITSEFEHMDNNYANKSMPIGGPGSGSGPDDPQYFDCHERTSGLYPAYLATALCVVLAPLYAALDPQYGCWRPVPWREALQEKNRKADVKMREEILEEVMREADVPPEEQAEALWQWAEGTADDGGKRWLLAKEITQMAGTAGMEHGVLRELLEVVEREPIRGPSMFLRKGSAVRHNGRRGTAATEPTSTEHGSIHIRYDTIQIRWEDDGTLSGGIKVSELDVEVGVGREAFVAACTQHPERTAKMYLHAMPTCERATPEVRQKAQAMKDAPAEAERKADAAVLEAKIEAVWRWADSVGDGALNRIALERLSGKVGEETDNAKIKLNKMYAMMQAEWEPVREGSAVRLSSSSPRPRQRSLDVPEAISVTADAFAAACHKDPKRTATWFEALRLPLVEEGRGCLDELCACLV